MAGEILAATLIAATAAAAGEQTGINADAICAHLPPGISIVVGPHRFTRTENGGCTIENTNIRRPAPSQPSGEEQR